MSTLNQRLENAVKRRKIAEAKLAEKRATMATNFLSIGTGGYDAAKKSRFNTGGSTGINVDMSPDEAVLQDLDELRRLSRDAGRNNPIGRGVVNKVVSGSVGTGLKYRPAFRRSILERELGMDANEIDALQEKTLQHWTRWAESDSVDYCRRLNFDQIQEQLARVTSYCGEFLVVFQRSTSEEFALRLRCIHPMQLKDPPETLSENTIIKSGVELHREGWPVAYHILKDLENVTAENGYVRIAAKTGDNRPNILHVYKQLEPGQTRGVPRLASILGYLKNIDRVDEASIIGELVRNYLTAFITTPNPADWQDQPDDAVTAQDETDSNYPSPERQIRLGPGAVQILGPGEGVEMSVPRADSGYPAWMDQKLKFIGMDQEIPFEVLLDWFQSSYSASRAARLSWRNSCNLTRTQWIAQFHMQIIREFIYLETVMGRLELPGFLDSPLIQYAYEGAKWDGDAIGLLDPKEESMASKQMVDAGFSTLAEQTSMLTGGDWRVNANQRAEEVRLYEQLGLGFDQNTAPESS